MSHWRDPLIAAGYWDGGDLLHVPTSGTSEGAPRVVVRTVRSWTDSFEPFSEVTGIRGDDVVLAAGPHTSLFVYARAHAASVGARVIAEPRWRPALSAEATVAHLTPTMLSDVLAVADSRLRLAIVAGAALAPGLREQAEAVGVEVVEYYGAAELSFVAIGRGTLAPFPQVEVESRGGVLWARSPWTAIGYAGGQDGPLRRDGDWCSVGDHGVVSGGTVTVSGRSGVITTGGVTVAAAEVDAVLRAAPGVIDCAVLGVPHERLGEVIAAVVVGGSRGRVVAHARAALPAPQRPVRWFSASALPTTDAGKLSVAALRAAIESGEVERWTP